MKFTKMQAAGNDFVLINNLEYNKDLGKYAKEICDRHFGIGADGLIFCSESDRADIFMNFYNSDGSRAEMCGNGIRCFTKFIYENDIVKKDIIYVDTLAGIKKVKLDLNEKKEIISMSVSMGKIDYNPKNVPCTLGNSNCLNEKVIVDGEEIIFSAVLMGVPHAIIIVDEFDEDKINTLGKKLESHKIFPNKINVNFVKKIDDKTIQIKTWERGAGRTLGCGTGSTATAGVLHKLKIISNNEMEVINDGGSLFIKVLDDGEIILSGNANNNFKGEI